MAKSFATGEVSTNSGGLVIWPAKGLLLAGFVLLAFQGLSEIIKKIAVMRGLIDDPNPFVPAHEATRTKGALLAGEIKRWWSSLR